MEQLLDEDQSCAVFRGSRWVVASHDSCHWQFAESARWWSVGCRAEAFERERAHREVYRQSKLA